MGVVFRALDTKLGRDVALKLLPEHFADDPERLARFRREARVLASLNHPNIAQIHELEDSTAQTCIVMELVEGETLSPAATRFTSSPSPALEAKHKCPPMVVLKCAGAGTGRNCCTLRSMAG